MGFLSEIERFGEISSQNQWKLNRRKKEIESKLISIKLREIENIFTTIITNLNRLKDTLINKLIFSNQAEAEVPLLMLFLKNAA